MTTTKKLKIWTILSHACIVVGFGHGVIILLLIEIMWFPYFTRDFSFFFNESFAKHLPVVGFTTLLGQAALIISILNTKQVIKLVSQIGGVILLWASIFYFTNYVNEDSDIVFVTLTSVPFVICTIITFLGEPIKNIYDKIHKSVFD